MSRLLLTISVQKHHGNPALHLRHFRSYRMCWTVATLPSRSPPSFSTWLCTLGGYTTWTLSKRSLVFWQVVEFGQWDDLAGHQRLGEEKGCDDRFPAQLVDHSDGLFCLRPQCGATLSHHSRCRSNHRVLCSGTFSLPMAPAGFW